MVNQPSDLELKSHWAYRRKQGAGLQEVRVLKLGVKRPKWAHVLFVDPAEEGKEEWVPIGRLKCSWSDMDPFLERERHWTRVREASVVSPGMFYALNSVLAFMPCESVATSMASGPADGVVEFKNPPALSAALSIPETTLCGAPEAFEEDGDWVVPFATGLVVARKLASLNADLVLMEVERDEKQLREQTARWASLNPHTKPTRQSQEWDEAMVLSHKIRREWVGAESNRLRQAAMDSAAESARLRNLVDWAIRKLSGYGHHPSASTLQKYLDGTPITPQGQSTRKPRIGSRPGSS